MERRKVSLAIALTTLLMTMGGLRTAHSQCSEPSAGTALQPVGANDLQATSFATTPWWNAWTSRFGSISVNGWGRTPSRQGVVRASTAVLRERRSLLR